MPPGYPINSSKGISIMASITREPNGKKSIQFVAPDGKKRPRIRLGKVPMRTAEAIKVKIELLVTAKIAGHATDDETARWVSGLDQVMANKLASVGLIPKREYVTLHAFVSEYVSSRTDVEPETARAWRQVMRRLVKEFGTDCVLKNITRTEAAEWRQSLVNEGLADATVRKYTGYAKHFFGVAVERDLLNLSPFSGLVSGSVGNDERQREVTRGETQRLIDECPNADMRLIVALSRYGGLRCPSEHLELLWADIDWAGGTMTVRSPKTRKQGKPSRQVPIFDELRPFLEDCWDLAKSGSEYVLTKYRSKNGAYIRKRLDILIERAGLTRWPRITHNLRASRQTELERNNPTHVVCAIMGNTPAVANRHYLQVSKDDLLKAAGKAAHNPAQYSACSGRIEPQTESEQLSRELPEPSTVPLVATQCEGIPGSGQTRSAGVDGNRTHLAPFQGSHRV